MVNTKAKRLEFYDDFFNAKEKMEKTLEKEIKAGNYTMFTFVRDMSYVGRYEYKNGKWIEMHSSNPSRYNPSDFIRLMASLIVNSGYNSYVDLGYTDVPLKSHRIIPHKSPARKSITRKTTRRS